MVYSWLSLPVLLTLLVILIIIVFLKRYKRCPSDKLLVIYGKIGKGPDGERTAKVIHGGAAFVWPILQDYQYMDLTPIPIEVDLKGALSKQNIRINVPARFLVAISDEPAVMQKAAERLLGLSLNEIHDLAADIIFGQLRVVIASMTIEEINSDRHTFAEHIYDAVEQELKKIGLKLINVNITDIKDESGYIEALGQEEAARAINEAKKSVAEKERDGQIGIAQANKEKRIKVAEANAEAEIGEAQANMRKRIQTSEANAKAVEGENLAQIKIAQSNAKKRIEVSNAWKQAEIAEKTNEAEARKAAFLAEKEAEMARAEKNKATQYADIIVKEEIEKQRIEIQANAQAEKIRIVAKGEADKTFYNLDAIAKGNLEILSKQAEGFRKIVDATNNDTNSAIRMMIADKLEKLVQLQVDAIKNIKIDKITVWDSGSGEKNSSTANFIKNLYSSIPPLENLFNMAGMNLPEYLAKKNTSENQEFVNSNEEEVIPEDEINTQQENE